MPLLSFDISNWNGSPRGGTSNNPFHSDELDHPPKKPLTAYGLLSLVFVFILGPQPSVVLLCTNYYILVQKSWTSVAIYLGVNYALIFMMLSSLMVTLIRDPGPVKPLEELENEQEDLNDTSADHRDSEDISLAEALMSREEDHRAEAFSLTPVKSTGESRWCRKCWAPKPERTHHCSECNRCVLKMDHHCPWLANRCVGQRTYPSFLHFLLTATIYSAFCFFLSIAPIQYCLGKPFILDDQDMTPYHAMTIALLGAFFSLTIGSFFMYHMYLTLTNQTTLESLAPMLLLQYLPDPPPPSPILESEPQPPPFSSHPPSPRSSIESQSNPPPYFPPPPRHRSQAFEEPFRFPSPPPLNQPPRRLQEHELNRAQRQLVREAHAKIRIYDLGWKENLKDILGGEFGASGNQSITRQRHSSWRIWAERIVWGGRGRGDGHAFRHNPSAEAQLRQLASDLVAAATR